ncbi:MAG TPA: hypothetical protein VIU15_37840 [Streptomyces sp.]
MSGQYLPRTYWCHADYDGPEGTNRVPLGTTTTAPGQAVEWMRDGVRALIHTFDREDFEAAWGWLGDHRALDAAVADLRRGHAYDFSAPAPEGTWTWTAYPVSVLPLMEECVDRGRSRSSVPKTLSSAAVRRTP